MKTVGLLLMILLLLAGYASSQDSAVISTDAPGFATGQDNYNYVGVIKNQTRYEVSVPSRNSDATLIIPARGFIEYISYEKDFDVTVYRDGKPFDCLKIKAQPHQYAFMCKNDYDFIAEIVKPEPAAKSAKYRKMKRAIKKPKPRPEGEQVG
ncbi:MAG: hypothetical protein NTY36_03600 [Deltaproteobacteria bacterium]|nr:hypothetical protein [Deltaproteobacteria bacterium]